MSDDASLACLGILLSGVKFRHKKTGVVWSPISCGASDMELRRPEDSHRTTVSIKSIRDEYEIVKPKGTPCPAN